MVGGETRSQLWNQIKADVCGRRIRIPEVDDAAALGAALLAGTGVGQYTSLKKAAEQAVRNKSVFAPNLENHRLYANAYKNYRTVYSQVEKGYSVY